MLSRALLLATAAFLCLSLVRAPYLSLQPMQNSPTVLALVLLLVCERKRWLSASSIACLVLFLWLHILGARYIYSYVPYDEWSAAVFGSTVSDWFSWERNQYDRLVHVGFGVLWMVPLTEVAMCHGHLSRWPAIGAAVLTILGVSALYEIFEWYIAVTMAPTYAEAYNGQQGDLWDPQKDMALALLGSLAVIPLLARSKSLGKI